jgi:SPP1 family phage portal protein
MDLWTTDKSDLDTLEIEKYILRHMAEVAPRMDKLWDYYLGKNPTILARKVGDPDNRTPFAYGRKIVTTFTGYAYRPGFIEYKPRDGADDAYILALQEVFDRNRETIKTERAGRNTAIFGVAYEIHYISGMVGANGTQAIPRFYNVDPREIIMLYDEEPEPQRSMGIRYYRVDEHTYKVELYLKDKYRTYLRTNNGSGTWEYTLTEEGQHFYGDVPITAYYMGDEKIGLIDPVSRILDDYDLLVSDSMVEFSRFANAYLRIVNSSIGDPTGQNPKVLKETLSRLKMSRVFDRLRDKDDVTFLTKDIPKDFVDFMEKILREQIHSQSHVPDFGSEKFSGALSGAAIERMLFDFENVVSSAEADFDQGLRDRIDLVTRILSRTQGIQGKQQDVVISHRRNIPIDEADSAAVAVAMRNAGLSMETVLDNMPRAMVPNVQEELKRQQGEAESMVDVDLAPDQDDQDDNQAEEA